MRGNIEGRLGRLEAQMPKPPQRTEMRPELREFLDRYKKGKFTGTLSPEDEATAEALKQEVKRRRAAGEIGG